MSNNRTYEIQVEPIKFRNSDELMDVVLNIDKFRLYQSNKPQVDPSVPEEIDGTCLGLGSQVLYSYDNGDLTLEINTNGGVCADYMVEHGFSASELVVGMARDQFDFLAFMKSVCEKQNTDAQATLRIFENGTFSSERKIQLREYQSRYF